MPGTYRTREGGFTYMGMLVAIVVIGITSLVVAQTWKSVSRVQKERQLIWCGHQFRNAIRGYYEYRKKLRGGADGNYYPTELKDLLSDPGRVGGYSWLRKIYVDPMTGKDDWVLVRTTGGVKGVHSASDAEPLRKAGFDVDDSSFTGKTRYSEWVFEYPASVTYAGPPIPGYIDFIKGGGKGGTGEWGPGEWPTGGTTGWPGEQPNKPKGTGVPGGWPTE